MNADDLRLPTGYRFAGVASGLRNEPGRRDLALMVSDRPASAAGVYTQNRVCAAPVHLCRERTPSHSIRGIVVCSGNANACTGDRGAADARRMAELAAIGCDAPIDSFLVASTGVIGRPLPMPILEAGIPNAAAALSASAESFSDAAHAILTTDTCIKTASYAIVTSRGTFRLAGFAKGAAMIGPNMATMLGFALTDAPVRPDDLQTILRAAVEPSFNCISVEGHTSTNDTVLILANGEGDPLAGADLAAFSEVVRVACADLARAIVADAEGANHFVTIRTTGCRNDVEAKTIAKTVAESALVKTAIYGSDPNWGRFVSAAGYSGVIFEEADLSLHMGPFLLYDRGVPLPFDAKVASAYLRDNREVELRLTFSLGAGACTFYTCDLTPEYVRLNADYTT